MRKVFSIIMYATLFAVFFQSCSTKEYDENVKVAFKTMEEVYNESNMVKQTMKKIVESYIANDYKLGKEKDALAEMSNEQYDTFEKDGVGKRIA